VDLVGKGGHIRTVPVPDWVKATVDFWTTAAGLSGGRVFRCVCRAGKHWGDGVTERLVWHVVKQYAAILGLAGLAPHDLRRYAESANMPNTVSGDAPAGQMTVNDSA
jgi:site-specific recombinase XerD